MSAQSVISVRDVSKRFVIRRERSIRERLLNLRNRGRTREDFWALQDVDLEVSAGETIGLVGANGSGKSTLLKVIGGIIQPTKGDVEVQGRIAALLELGAGFHPDLTGRENVYLNAALLGLDRKATDRVFDEIVDFSGIEEFIDTQVKFYSSGMYVRLAFAVAVHVDPEVLLVDEVLAVGDEPFQRKCLDRIKRFQHEGRTIALVSHSAETIGEHCTRAVVLKHGVVQFEGETAGALRVLRDGFGDDALEERAPDGPVIERVVLRGADGEPVSGTVRSGDSLAVDVVVDARGQELVDWNLGIALETPLGHVVYGTNTDLLGIETKPFAARRKFTFSLPDVRLGTGRYQFRVALATSDHGLYDQVPIAALFDVDNGAFSIGDLQVVTAFRESDG